MIDEAEVNVLDVVLSLLLLVMLVAGIAQAIRMEAQIEARRSDR